MANFIVYDGRAKFNFDDACVIDCFEAKDKSEAKRLYIQRGWSGIDSVLADSEQNIIY